MRKIIIPILCIVALVLTYIYIDPITDEIASFISEDNEITIKEINAYTKSDNYLFVQNTSDYIPYSYQDLLNIYYSTINNGWKQFTFYCPKEYTNCIEDISNISSDEVILTHLNNYVHPFNSFTNIKTTISDSGEITLKVNYLYTDEEIKKIDSKTDELLAELIKSNMSDEEKIKTLHDYIIDNAKYDTEKNNTNESEYHSYNAYGPLFEGYAICNGYTDLMAIYLTKLGFNNYKIATTPQDNKENEAGHVWNAIYYNNKWLHIDLTWDDPVSSDGKNYLFHTYFLVTTAEMHKADDGETKITEHDFNPLFYLEYN